MSTAGSLYHAIQGDAWDDLLVPATAVPIRGNAGDPDADPDGTLLFDKDSAEQIAMLYQMPHAWASTGIRFHCHWSKSTDAAGDVVWEMRYRIFNNNAVPGAWGDWTAATTRSQAIAANQAVLIDGWPEIDMTGIKGSGWAQIQLRRNPDATADNYAADARLYGADCHYRRFGLGSDQEYPT